MKKVIVGVASVLASALLMAGCNKQVIDLTYEYNWAQLKKCPTERLSRAMSKAGATMKATSFRL